MNIISNSLAKLALREYVNSEKILLIYYNTYNCFPAITTEGGSAIRSNLRRQLKYLLLKNEIMQYWASKGKLKYLPSLDSDEDLGVFHYAVPNIPSHLSY